MAAHTVLLPSSGSSLSVKLHPVVLFAICDAYVRRGEKQDRVIGTLLGVVSNNVVEVKNCYVVPHNESSEQVALDIAHHKTMFDLHQKVTPLEGIVGWFATGPALYNSDALIQEFYNKEATGGSAVHLLVDTTLAERRFTLQAFTSRALSLGERVLATEFVEVPLETLHADVERVGADLLLTGSAPKALSEAENLATSVRRLQAVMAKVHAYVQDVAAGRRQGDPTIGRHLADTMALVPHFSRPAFERLFNDAVQDALVATYLADLLRSHIALAEKLGTAALPIM